MTQPHHLQPYCFLGQTHFYQKCGLWERSRQICSVFRSEKDSKYFDVKLKMFKKDDNRDFRLLQNLTLGETDFNQFLCLRNQLFIAAGNFGTEEYSTSVLISTMSKDMDEQLKLCHKVVDVVDCPYKKACVTLLRYNVDKPKSSYAQVLLFARRREGENFQ